MAPPKVASTRHQPAADAVAARSRSGALLRRVSAQPALSASDIQRAMQMTTDDFDQVVAGTKVMSLPHQLCLAAFLIEHVPDLARAGRTLRHQALAAMEYGSGATATHGSQPLKWSRLR